MREKNAQNILFNRRINIMTSSKAKTVRREAEQNNVRQEHVTRDSYNYKKHLLNRVFKTIEFSYGTYEAAEEFIFEASIPEFLNFLCSSIKESGDDEYFDLINSVIYGWEQDLFNEWVSNHDRFFSDWRSELLNSLGQFWVMADQDGMSVINLKFAAGFESRIHQMVNPSVWENGMISDLLFMVFLKWEEKLYKNWHQFVCDSLLQRGGTLHTTTVPGYINLGCV